MKKFDLYLFDFDGTLVDTYESLTHVFEGAYQAVGVSIKKEDIPKLMRSSLEAGYEYCGGPRDRKSVKTYVKMIVKLLDDETTLTLSKTYPEVKEVLTKLSTSGARLGIVTSNSKHHVIDVLHHIGLDEKMFDVIIGNGETRKRKPNPDPVLKALKVLKYSKAQTCYVGDALDDMRCGISAGVETILVDRYNEYQNEECIKIKTLDELVK